MSVVQINRWQCEVCGRVQETREETSAYSDPVVGPPDGWTTDLSVPIDRRVHPNWDVCDACPQCAVAPDWSKYPAAEQPTDDALNAAINRAARDLPDGLVVAVHAERGSGWVTFESTAGERFPKPDGDYDSLAAELNAVIDYALAEQAKEQK